MNYVWPKEDLQGDLVGRGAQQSVEAHLFLPVGYKIDGPLATQYEVFPEYLVPDLCYVCSGTDPLPLSPLRYRCHCRRCFLPRLNLHLCRVCHSQTFPNKFFI